MSYKGTTIVKAANEVVPEIYIDRVLARYKSCMGAAIVDEKGELLITNVSAGGDKVGIMETMEIFKEYPILFHFGSFEHSFHQDDVQPFVLLRDEVEQPLVVACVEGDFPGFARSESTHPNEFFVANEMLAPELSRMMRLVDGDLAKLMAEMEDPVVKRSYLNNMATRGSITLLATNGKILTYEKDSVRKDFHWGWASDLLGYTEQTFPAKEEEPAKRGLFGRAKASVASVITKQEAPKTETVIKPADLKPTGPSEEIRYFQPGKGITSNNALRRAYQTVAGFVPENFKTRPKVVIQKKGPIKDFKEAAIALGATPLPAVKDTGTKHIASTEPVKTAMEVLPIIPADQKKKIMEEFLVSSLVAPSMVRSVMPDPKTIQEWENKLPDYAEQVGLDGLEKTFSWTYEIFREHAKKYPEASAVLMLSYLRLYIKLLIETGGEITSSEESEDAGDVINDEPVVRREALG